MKNLLFLFLFLFFQNLAAQETFYDLNTVQEIRIYFEQDDWDADLDANYVAGEGARILANLVINGEAVDSVGIRYKGFSSVSVDREKNPFNIKLDYIKGNQHYDGINKIKLSNVIQDPSFLRETLSYSIARQYLPSSRANYAKVFINDEYWGLYTNVESVNKDFLVEHYGSNDNAFFKCNPEDLDFDGENSNLGNAPGTDTTEYFPFYDIESDAGWTDLYELIDVLNESPEDIESVLNVDRTLWMHAFNYALINFDSYVGYAQNYYVYRDDNGQFNPILWDLNQSFASYRLTDASEHFDGFSIAQAKTMDPLLHYSSVSVIPRPLMRNLFENDTYRRQYIAHLRTIIEENFESQSYITLSENLRNLIEEDVLADENKFYTDDDFYDNLNETVTDLVDYPGITDLMAARTEYLQTYPAYQGAPMISNLTNTPSTIISGGNVFINAEITNSNNVVLAYRYGGNGIFQKVNMTDNGTQNDGTANDGIYGAELINIGNSIQYYIYAENEVAGRFSPERAAYEFHLLQGDIETGEIVLNEILAKNTDGTADEGGDLDDWIELYNTTDFSISLAGLYLSDGSENLQKWALPDVAIAADDYLIIWADEDQEQGALHANFKLSGMGEAVFLTNENGDILDMVEFGEQTDDRSYGRFPNGTGDFTDMPPSFSGVNSLVSDLIEVGEETVSIFPNPVQDLLKIEFSEETPREIKLYSIDGKLIKIQKVNTERVFLNVKGFPEGLYYMSLIFENQIFSKKITIAK